MRGAPEVRVQDVQAHYPGHGGRTGQVLDLDFAGAPGEITALVGPNGAGKTTTMRILLGFLTPSHGSVMVGDMTPARYRARFGIGYVPERRCLPGHWTPRELIRRGADLVSTGSDSRVAAEAAVRTGLAPEVLDRVCSTLSRGMAQRVTLAWALLGDPRLLLLDEPLTGLDAAARAGLRAEIRRAKLRGTTVILASHDLREVEVLADRVVVLEGGTVLGHLVLKGKLSAEDLEALVLGSEQVS